MEYTTHFVLQSQATRLSVPFAYRGATAPYGAITLYGQVSETELDTVPPGSGLRPQFLKEDLGIDLFPFQSPLLWESLLVSFPPLSNMFKFSGSPYLRSARGERRFTAT